MFTGIIEETGVIKTISKGKNFFTFKIGTKNILKNKKRGQSISINGACMTIKSIKSKDFEFDVMPESLAITNLGKLKKNDTVNMESSLKLNGTIDGHFVQGHVDCTGKIVSSSTENKRAYLKISYPSKIKKFLTLKGSISINGVSLTISRLSKSDFSVDLIPETLEKTNLSKLKKGDYVNLETDLLAKYLNSLING